MPRLDLAVVDLPLLVHRLLAHIGDDLAGRSIALELNLTPQLRRVAADEAALEAPLQLLLRVALQAQPVEGGRLGLRTRVARAPGKLLLELAQDGNGAGTSMDTNDSLERARLLIEQQEGTLNILSDPGRAGWPKSA